MSRPFGAVAVVGTLVSVLGASVARSEDWKPKVDALVKPAVESGVVTGLAIGVVYGDNAKTFGYGKVSAASQTVPDETTLFEIGSVTKVFTALALADMVRERLVSLDDPVRKWLPDSVKVPSRDGKEITLECLSTHASGLPRLGRSLELQALRNPLNPYAQFTVDDLYATLAASSLANTPGTKYAYSNLGVGLLGHVLARRAGMSYDELIRRRVCTPLGMAETRITLPDAQKFRLAEGHDIDGNPLPPWDIPTLAGCGALRSNVRDLVRLVQANLGLPKSPLAEAIQSTHKPRLDIGPGQAICLGWHLRKAEEILWHNGQTGGYHSFVGLRKNPPMGVVVLGNTAGGTVDAIGYRLLDLLAGKEPKPLPLKAPIRVDPAILEQYLGNYEMYPNFILSVTRTGDRLWVQATNQPRLGIYPESETKFSYRAVNAQITFVRNKEGKIDKMIVRQHGLDLPAWKGGLIVHFGGQLLQGLKGLGARRGSPDTAEPADRKVSSAERRPSVGPAARRPASDKELRYWLENMVVYHRFWTEEAAAATGLPAEEVHKALKRWDLRPGSFPQRRPGDPLLVLPYPGGRHPRLGFLDGAVDPQRETKTSIFTPWDSSSYVVFDVPEAIWSNLGLTYLAHTHIPTIWTQQGVALPAQEWERRQDGTLHSTRRLPNGIAFAVEVKPKSDAVQFDLSLTNGTDKPLAGLRIQNCLLLGYAAGFNRQASDNKLSRHPYAVCRCDDGKRWIIIAWKPCRHTWDNAPCPCLHSDPVLPDCPPGQTSKARGYLWFYEGSDIDGELARLAKKTGWPIEKQKTAAEEAELVRRVVRQAGNVDDDRARLEMLKRLQARPGLESALQGDVTRMVAVADRWVNAKLLSDFGAKPYPDFYDLGIAEPSPLYPLACLYRARMLVWITLESGGFLHDQNRRRELLDKAVALFKVAQAAFPENRVVRMYLGEPIPCAKQYPPLPGAPRWAVLQRENLERLADIVYWWIDHRMKPDGQYGGGWGDDCEMWRFWVPVLVAFDDPKIVAAQARFSAAMMSQTHMSKGYTAHVYDVEHTAEDSADVITPMMHLEPDNPLWQQRARRLAELMENLWTGRNQRGQLQFRSTYFSVDRVDGTAQRACDTVYHPRAVQPALLLWQRTGDPKLGKLFSAWMDTWVDATARCERGKPGGIIPSAIHWPDGNVGGLGPDWWDPRNHGEATLYQWPSAVTMMLDTLLLTYHMTGNEKYLQPIRSMAASRLKWRKAPPKSPPAPGSEAWCAAQLGLLSGTLAKYRALTGSREFLALECDDSSSLSLSLRAGDGKKKAVTSHRTPEEVPALECDDSSSLSLSLRAGDGKKKAVTSHRTPEEVPGLESSARALRVNFEGYTSEVRFTDRVLRFPALFGRDMMFREAIPSVQTPDPSLVYRSASGDPGEAGYFPLARVRWLTPPRDIAARVTASGPRRFEAELFHFGDRPRPMGAELYLLAPGQYRFRVIPAGEDVPKATPFSVKSQRTRIEFLLPPQKVCILRVELP